MATFSHKGVNYHVSMWGDKHKAPLILLHGFSQSADTWKPLSHDLAQLRYVVAPDFIGHGKSDKPVDPKLYDMKAIHEWLTVLIQWLEVDRVDLLGYSMGGRIALSYAVDAPKRVASLVLESTGLGPSSAQQREDVMRRDKEMIEKLSAQSLEEFMDVWEKLPVFESQKNLAPEVRESLRAARMKNDPHALALTVQGTGQHIMPDYLQDICLLPMPILYIAGMLDRRYMKIAEKLQGNKGITSLVLNAGHSTHLEAPEAFTHQVNAFLRDSSPLSKEKSVNLLG